MGGYIHFLLFSAFFHKVLVINDCLSDYLDSVLVIKELLYCSFLMLKLLINCKEVTHFIKYMIR